MKRLPLLLMFVCLYATNIVGQDIYSQQQALADMLSRNEFFKARKQRQLCGDSIDKSLELCYAFKMHGYLNRPDSSAIYLEKILKEYPDFFGDRYSKMYFINELLNMYAEMGNYSKMSDAYDIAELVIKPYLLTNDSTWAKQQLMAISQLRCEYKEKLDIPQMTVTNLSKKKETSITFTEEPVLTSVIECNGLPIKTWIDTGWGNAVFMTKTISDKCKVKKLPSLEDSITVNGVLVRAHRALVDSLKIGSILFDHVPAIVIHGDLASFAPDNALSEKHQHKYDSIMNSTEFIVGISLLRRLGSIQFDWHKKKIKMKLASDIAFNKKEPNMFIEGQKLYTQIFINSINYIGWIDTGALETCIELTKEYYDTNQIKLPINETEKEKCMGRGGMARITTIKYRPILNPEVIFNLKTVKLTNEDVIAWQRKTATIGSQNGLIGNLFFKRLGSKVKFDFVNMQIVAD